MLGRYHPVRLVLSIIVAAITLRSFLFYWGGIELHYDEAQYWEWSRQLDWGYYSKGPLIAWLIALSESAFGHGLWQTRVPAWLASGLFMWLLFRCSMTVWQDSRAALWAVILAIFCPVYFLLGGVMTTDILLFVFYTWGIWSAYRAIVLKQSSAWLEFGAAVGLGCLTKLSMLLLPLALFFVMMASAHYRKQWLTSHPWRAILVTLLIVSPMLWWNAQHDWVLLRHELGHVQARGNASSGVLNFITGQLLAFLPLVVVFIFSLFEKPSLIRKNPTDRRFLWALMGVCLAFFLFKSLSSKVQINWPAPIYISALIMLSGTVQGLSSVAQRVLIGVLFFMGITMSIVFFPGTVGLQEKSAPFKEMKAWEMPVQRLHKEIKEIDFIIVHSYKLAGEIAYFWPESIPVYVAGNVGRRFNQHDLWPSIEREAGKNGAYIDTVNRPPEVLARAFSRCSEVAKVQALANDGSLMRTLYIRRCEDYQPIAWPSPSGY